MVFWIQGHILVFWETSIPVWAPKHAPKKDFSCFLFWVVFQQKMCLNSNQWFHNASSYFWIGLEDKNADRREKQWGKRGWSERRNCLWKCFHSFKFVMDHANIHFFFLISLWTCSHFIKWRKWFKLLPVIRFVLLTVSFQVRLLGSFHKFVAIQIYIWICKFF